MRKKTRLINPGKLFNDELMVRIWTNGDFLLTESGLVRKAAQPYTHSTIEWYEVDDDGNYMTVALMDLKTTCFWKTDEMFWSLDEISAGYGYLFEAATKYADEHDFGWSVEDGSEREYCEINHFYISPKYRGKGLANALLLQLTNILPELYIESDRAVIVTIVNPFRDQERDLSGVRGLVSEAFGGYEDDKTRKKELTEIMVKPLNTCGFEKVHISGEGLPYYATSLGTLRRICDSVEIGYNDFSTCEIQE